MLRGWTGIKNGPPVPEGSYEGHMGKAEASFGTSSDSADHDPKNHIRIFKLDFLRGP